jgi:hypothetical protein
VGTEFLVNTYTLGTQRHPSLAMDSDGDVVVAWTAINGQGIFARRYDSAGVPQGTEMQVNTYVGQQDYPSVASDSTGDFIVAWQSFLQDGSYNGVFARYFRSSGVAIGDEIRSIRRCSATSAPRRWVPMPMATS